MKNPKPRDFAINLAKTAGEIMLKNFSLGTKKSWKTDITPLTITDTIINDLVLKEIKNNFPNYSIISEECSSLKNSDYAWICDPLDGTVPFSHGFPIFTFSLALTHRGESILGVIYDPFLKRLLVAEKTKGTYLNNKKVSVSPATKFNQTVIEVGAFKPHLYDLNPIKQVLTQKGSFIVSFCSASYAGLLVALGELAATVFGGNKSWDAAAVKIIVEEADGKVTSLSGAEQDYDKKTQGFIASNGKLHNQLVSLVKPLL